MKKLYFDVCAPLHLNCGQSLDHQQSLEICIHIRNTVDVVSRLVASDSLGPHGL